MGVDHRRLHVAMAQQFLDGPDVMTGFEKMGRERVAERVARGSPGEAFFDNGVSYGSLHQGFVDVMAILLFYGSAIFALLQAGTSSRIPDQHCAIELSGVSAGLCDDIEPGSGARREHGFQFCESRKASPQSLRVQ